MQADCNESIELTPAQKRVARLIRDGHHPQQIAKILDIGVCTVKTHCTAIYKKFGLGENDSSVALAVLLDAPLDSPFRALIEKRLKASSGSDTL